MHDVNDRLWSKADIRLIHPRTDLHQKRRDRHPTNILKTPTNPAPPARIIRPYRPSIKRSDLQPATIGKHRVVRKARLDPLASDPLLYEKW